MYKLGLTTAVSTLQRVDTHNAAEVLAEKHRSSIHVNILRPLSLAFSVSRSQIGRIIPSITSPRTYCIKIVTSVGLMSYVLEENGMILLLTWNLIPSQHPSILHGCH